MNIELISADSVVSPLIMDVRIWAYAKEVIGRNLIAILRGGGSRSTFRRKQRC